MSRMSFHNLKVYKFIRNNGGFDNWNVVEIEKYDASDKYDLYIREQFFYYFLGATLNQHVPGRTRKQWDEANKESRKGK